MPPPRYKVALLTWIGIFPVITLLLSVLGPTLASRSVVVRAFVLTACAIPIMTWIVMPIVTRFTGAWLHAGPRNRPARAKSDQLSSGPAP